MSSLGIIYLAIWMCTVAMLAVTQEVVSSAICYKYEGQRAYWEKDLPEFILLGCADVATCWPLRADMLGSRDDSADDLGEEAAVAASGACWLGGGTGGVDDALSALDGR